MNLKLKRNGEFYTKNQEKTFHSEESKRCIENTVQKLLDNETTIEKLGMLLGKIQSGKTRTFIGVISLAFDNGYDVAIVFTKGTKALARQTLRRLKSEFDYFINNQDELEVYDIMFLPEKLTRYQRGKKLIFVVKKEDDNLRRLDTAFSETYPDLLHKKVLIVDDEADYASIGFRKNKREGTKVNVITKQVSDFRKSLETPCGFLQVTATPASLYLQPENYEPRNFTIKPLKPAFTELVPIHDKYIGSETYFGEASTNSSDLAYYLFQPVPNKEIGVLEKQDLRYINNILTTPNLRIFRKAIMTFIVGGCIRRLQNKHYQERQKKFSFVVHIARQKKRHEWQGMLVEALRHGLESLLNEDVATLKELVKDAHTDLQSSLEIMRNWIPSEEDIFEAVCKAIQNEYIGYNVVNSDNSIETLLDDNGQLRLNNPFNIFIGGQILDRGLTIENLIGFFYGRSPKKFQQDTVTQHSRMYGARPKEDLAVTRFYTATHIYEAMHKMHKFDESLRNAFKSGGHQEVVFIRRENGNILPCSPNKILLSDTTTIHPHRRLLPLGFKTITQAKLKPIVSKLDTTIDSIWQNASYEEAKLISIDKAENIIDNIGKTLKFEDGYKWDVKEFKATMRYLSSESKDETIKNHVYIVVRYNREINRFRGDGRFEGSPDTASEPTSEGTIARKMAKDIPSLILLRQNGRKEKNWKSNHPFWWPILIAPKNTEAIIFANKVCN
ncbi:MAG: Z1 domain-containing protein [Chitinophagales bacterium]